MATALERNSLPTGRTLASRGLDVSLRHRLASESGTFNLDVAFVLRKGINILFGPSGAGKTTLLECIAGLATPDTGRIALRDRVLFDSERNINVPPRHRNVGYVFQDLALFPHLSVEANVAYGLQGFKASERKQRLLSALESLGILDLRHRRPGQLSGGERQRVALARALVTDPDILLLDEPLAALDLPLRMQIADDLRRSVQNLPIPVLYVTHSRDEVFILGDRMLVLERGKLIAEGTPHEVMSAPRSETVAQLAGFENIFDAVVSSIHEERGTMTCLVGPGKIEIETPLIRAELGSKLRVGISAGDILLATSAPVGLSARNVLPGRLLSLSKRDVIVVARVDCEIEFFVHLTLSARDSLAHSCHLLAV
jgi:molybdate transport system ATP-binding protein